jgi:ubiquinone/menaquinone biosynthesis C-methylase UbiE
VNLVPTTACLIGWRYFGIVLAVSMGGGFIRAADTAVQPVSHASNYEFRQVHDRDGIGKFYMGREIAHVMGHQAAEWLERPEREAEEHTDQLIEQLNLRQGDVVADIGAGTGYLSRRLARRVGGQGQVLAVDIQPEMLDLLTNRMAGLGITNVAPVLGTTTDPKLPADAVDLVVMVDVYHEFDFPYEMMSAICRSLKPTGRVVFVEFRGEDPNVPIKRVHKMTEAQVKKEMAALPLRWKETIEVLPRQHIIIFGKEATER